MDDVVGDVQENEPKFSGETSSEQGNYFCNRKFDDFLSLDSKLLTLRWECLQVSVGHFRVLKILKRGLVKNLCFENECSFA